jgi:hypothetical protein
MRHTLLANFETTALPGSEGSLPEGFTIRLEVSGPLRQVPVACVQRDADVLANDAIYHILLNALTRWGVREIVGR